MEQALATLVTWKGVAVFLWLVAFFVGERLWPAAQEPRSAGAGSVGGGGRRVARNLGLWLANIGLSPLVVLPVSVWATQHHLGWRPDWWGGGVGLLLDIALLDFLIYWWHRANHKIPLLWRFHEIHHLDRFLDTTSALRFHFGEVLLSALARAAVIALFGVPIHSVLIFETLVLAAALFHHSNLRLPDRFERAMAGLFITPSIHWVHHHARQRDTDSNYGTIFSFWDPIFSTRSASRRRPDMAIGVERRAERPFVQLILRPFLSRTSRSEASP